LRPGIRGNDFAEKLFHTCLCCLIRFHDLFSFL
jgi:hypothetical protein